ncbi:RNA polymerase sigma factor [Pedobacter sp. WC2423]|uniref:RNA polymerase sigma factor n=1 Tax=Pedobacter sp. WC2423 TaxID=3234142 RepID=UPI003467C832
MERVADMNDNFNRYSKYFHLKNDEELISLIKEDVKAAHYELTERWATKLYKKAYRKLRNQSIVMDLVEQVFNELWVNRRKLKIRKASEYLVGSLKDKLYELDEKNELHSAYTESLNHFALVILKADSALSIPKIKELIDKWLLIQPPERVQIFNLKYKVKMTSKQICEKLDIPLNVVNAQINGSGRSLNEYVQRFHIMKLNRRKTHRIRSLFKRRKHIQ